MNQAPPFFPYYQVQQPVPGTDPLVNPFLVSPSAPPMVYAPPPDYHVEHLTDSMLALKIQQEENDALRVRAATVQRDELLARALATAEHQQNQTKTAHEKEDEDLARRLALEEQKHIQAAEEAKKNAEIARRKAEEARKKAEEAKRKLAQDEELAKKLADEEKKQLQLRKDFDLARQLDAKEKAAAIPSPPPKPAFQYPSIYGNHNNNYNNYSLQHRNHAVVVHNRHCYCRSTQTWNNNHVFSVHQTHCGCNFPAPVPSNAGRLHVHDYRCCSLDHIHNASCFCVYRKHRHTYLCCSVLHEHNDYCNCTDK